MRIVSYRAAPCRKLVLVLALAASALAAGCGRTSGVLSGTPSLNTARVALAGGSPNVAFEICDKNLARHPNDADLLACKGDALALMGRTSEAVGAYEAALARDAGAPDALLGLGRLRLASDPAAAETLFLRSLSRNPRNAAALNNLGIARDLQGRHLDAQTAYGEAIAAAPDLRGPQVNLALSLAMTGKSGEAVRLLRPIAERPDASTRERHDLAAVLSMDGKGDEAARLLRPELDGAQADDAVTRFRAMQAPR